MKWKVLVLMVFVLSACSDDPSPPAPTDEPDVVDMPDAAPDADPEPDPVARGTFGLPNGASLVVEDTIGLQLADRALVTLAGAPIRTLTYTETFSGPLAIWDFDRRDEVRTPFEEGRSVVEGENSVEVIWGAGEAKARLMVTEGPTEDTTRVSVSVEGAPYQSIELAFGCEEAATFYGFGEQYNAIEQRGEAFDLFVGEQGIGRSGTSRFIRGDKHTTYFPMPWWIDVERGFGVLFETPYRTLVDLCAADEAEARIEVTGGEPVSFLVFHGPGPLDLIEQLSEVVGRPKKPPVWAFEAPWISAQGGSEAVRGFIETLEANEVPYSAIWSQDWTGVRVNFDGGLGVEYRWEPDTDHYPDLNQISDDLHAAGKRFLGYANPFIDPELPNHFEEMAEAGLLIENANGEPYIFSAPNGTSSHPDFTADGTRAYVENALREMVEVHGLDGWMADFGEWTPLDSVQADGSDAASAHNLFPVWWHSVNRSAMEMARPDGDWVLFARSGWTGVQAHSMIHWVGDQEATWEAEDGLPTVVPAMLNLGLAGVPYVTHDIGGFSGGPSTKELYLRWIELGAFTPTMRTHEGNRRDENHNWDTDEETLVHFRRFARIHQALLPEWQALADEADATSAPIIRALMLHHPEDVEARTISDQFLIGEDLLVAPIVIEGDTSREVYLPEGQWFHVFTGESFEGPARVSVEAPIGTPPVFSLGRDRADLRAIE